jgi:hypothetical protein
MGGPIQDCQMSSILEGCETYIRSSRNLLRRLALSSETYQSLLRATPEGMKRWNSKYFSKIEKAKLAGEDIDVPRYWKEAIYDIALSPEEQYNLGVSDGMMEVCRHTLMRMGMDDLAQQAVDLIYRLNDE